MVTCKNEICVKQGVCEEKVFLYRWGTQGTERPRKYVYRCGCNSVGEVLFRLHGRRTMDYIDNVCVCVCVNLGPHNLEAHV